MSGPVSHEALMVEIKGINRRLETIEQRQDEMRQDFAELRGGKRLALWIFGPGDAGWAGGRRLGGDQELRTTTMLDPFSRAFNLVIGHEGGYTTDPTDRGNWTGGERGRGQLKGTKYGISAAAYPDLDIAALTLDEARQIYRADYWAAVRGDELP